MTHSQGQQNGPAAGQAKEHATGRRKLAGHVAAFAFAVLIAGSFSIGDLAAAEIGPMAINAARFALAVAVMAAAYAVTARQLPPLPKASWRFLLIGGLLAVYFILMFVALGISGPVSTGAVFNLIPLMSAGFGVALLGQRVPPLVLASLLIAGAGAAWVVFGGSLANLMAFRIGQGEAIFMIGCAAYAAHAPLVRRLNRGEPVLLFTLHTLVAATLLIMVAAIPEMLATQWLSLPAIVWWAIAYLAIFTTAGTFFLIQFASMRLPASKVLSYGYLTPSIIILIEGMIGHGWASLSVMAGAMVTAVALAVMAFAPDG